jgi:hypothetical protein
VRTRRSNQPTLESWPCNSELCLPRLVSSPGPGGSIDGHRAFSRNPGRRARATMVLPSPGRNDGALWNGQRQGHAGLAGEARVELVWLFAGPIAAASWPGEPGVIPEHWPMPVWVVVEPTRDSAWEPMPSPAASETRRWRTSWARASSGPLINALYSASHGLRARGRPDERSLRGKKARAPRTARVCEKPDPSFSRVSASAGCPGEMNAEADRLVGDALGRC